MSDTFLTAKAQLVSGRSGETSGAGACSGAVVLAGAADALTNLSKQLSVLDYAAVRYVPVCMNQVILITTASRGCTCKRICLVK